MVDLLKRVGAFSVQTNGSYGKASSFYLRGSDNGHTLVLIDGVRLMDMTSPSGGARLEFIDLNSVEEVEILKGSQGVLYGDGAIGGVINIKTREGESRRGSAIFSYGSYKEVRLSGDAYFPYKKNQLMFFASYWNAEGLSSYNDGREKGADRDGGQEKNIEFKWKNKGVSHLSFSSRMALSFSSYLYDDFDSDNKTNHGSYKKKEYALKMDYEGSSFFSPKLKLSHLMISRKLWGESSFGEFEYFYQGKSFQGELLNKSFYGDSGELLLGLDYRKEEGDFLDSFGGNPKIQEDQSFYIQNKNEFFKNFIVEEGLRYGKKNSFDKNLIYSFGGNLHLGKMNVKFTHGLGYKEATLYQLFSSFGGNKKLKEEESHSTELSLLYRESSFLSEMTFFYLNYSHYIDFNLKKSLYENRGDFRNYGSEWSLSYEGNNLKGKIHYTYLDSQNKETGEQLPRRSRHAFGVSGGYDINEYMELRAGVQYRGKRLDSNGKKLSSYLIAQVQAFYQWNNWREKISLTIDNILDKEYEELWGYGTKGRNFLASYRVNF